MSDGSAVRDPQRDSRDEGRKRATPATFLRQVIAELRKVVWPTQQQLVTYFFVVLVFVIVVMSFVAALDLAFFRLVYWMFTGGNQQ